MSERENWGTSDSTRDETDDAEGAVDRPTDAFQDLGSPMPSISQIPPWPTNGEDVEDDDGTSSE